QWSKNQFSPLNGTSRFTSSKTLRNLVMLSSYVAWRRNGHLFAASNVTTSFNSVSSEVGRSGRGSRKSSKSAAENTSISPAPLQRKKSSPLPGPVILIQRTKSSFSCFGFWVKRL